MPGSCSAGLVVVGSSGAGVGVGVGVSSGAGRVGVVSLGSSAGDPRSFPAYSQGENLVDGAVRSGQQAAGAALGAI